MVKRVSNTIACCPCNQLLAAQGLGARPLLNFSAFDADALAFCHAHEHAGYDLDCVADYGVPEEYIAAVALGKFGVRNWRVLDSCSLWQLFITIKNRVKKAGARGASLHKNSTNEPF